MRMDKQEKRKIARMSHKAQYALLTYLVNNRWMTTKLGAKKTDVISMIKRHKLVSFDIDDKDEFLIAASVELCGRTSVKEPKPPAKPKRKKVKATKSDDFLKSWEWTTLRYKVLKKYGRKCMCCGATPETGAVICVDHIKPRHTHPELALVESNLQCLCQPCNKGKGAWDDTDFRIAKLDE